ncbi:hypothetical protein, partial [Escherichia coli]|uniref:hypothetical protein n=1 Tax=Escherichia coli TaxID=562 RepID=UPI000B7E746B
RGEVQAATASATGLACFIFRFLRRPQKGVFLAERLAKVAVVLTNLVLSLSVLGLVYFIFQILGMR